MPECDVRIKYNQEIEKDEARGINRFFMAERKQK